MNVAAAATSEVSASVTMTDFCILLVIVATTPQFFAPSRCWSMLNYYVFQQTTYKKVLPTSWLYAREIQPQDMAEEAGLCLGPPPDEGGEQTITAIDSCGIIPYTRCGKSTTGIVV